MLLALFSASSAAATEMLIDDFESADSPAAWSFESGAEFPGATGSLAAGPGTASSAGASLSFDFTNGGNYVAMTRKLISPITATAIGFSASTWGQQVFLRVVDSTGQTSQYNMARPLEAGAPDAWYMVSVSLYSATLHWGGANDGVLHQPIKAVSIVVNNSPQKGRAGSVRLDDVVAWDSLPAKMDPFGTPLAAPSGSIHVTDALGVNMHFEPDNRALDAIQSAGIRHVRVDLGWQHVESSKGVYNFEILDKLVPALADRGLLLHLILDYFNPLYPQPADADFATTTIPAFAAMATSVASRFAGKGASYEVWNEENDATFWPPAPDGGQYGKLCAAAIAAVHAADPTALVSTGGLSGFDYSFLQAMIDAGAATGANAIGVHPYRHTGPESVSDDVAGMRALVSASLPQAPPVWNTEWGYSSQWYSDAGGSDAQARLTQAQRVSRELLSTWALGLAMSIYYDIRDDGTDPQNSEHNYGLLQNDYTEKPAMTAVRVLTSGSPPESVG